MIKPHHVKKYMRLAKQVGEDNNPCYSRHIGVVIVDPAHHRIVGTGYNGPPRDTPHCDDLEYLCEIVWPQLNPMEKERFVNAAFVDRETGNCKNEELRLIVNDLALSDNTGGLSTDDIEFLKVTDKQRRDYACGVHAGCKTCPRKLIGASSGVRLELCSCAHGETNAITNAGRDLKDCVMFCWCGVPCFECSKLIINSGIKAIYVIDWGTDYSHGSRWLFKKAGVAIHESVPDYYLEGSA